MRRIPVSSRAAIRALGLTFAAGGFLLALERHYGSVRLAGAVVLLVAAVLIGWNILRARYGTVGADGAVAALLAFLLVPLGVALLLSPSAQVQDAEDDAFGTALDARDVAWKAYVVAAVVFLVAYALSRYGRWLFAAGVAAVIAAVVDTAGGDDGERWKLAILLGVIALATTGVMLLALRRDRGAAARSAAAVAALAIIGSRVATPVADGEGFSVGGLLLLAGLSIWLLVLAWRAFGVTVGLALLVPVGYAGVLGYGRHPTIAAGVVALIGAVLFLAALPWRGPPRPAG